MAELDTFGKEKDVVHVIIETPRGSRNKYTYHRDLKLLRLANTLPLGSAFPFDFGCVMGTIAEDGDPIDVLVMIDEPVFPGCLVSCRLLGVLEAEQVKNGKKIRNDRLLAVALSSTLYADKKSVNDIDAEILKEIEHFFISYNEIIGRQFIPLTWQGPSSAIKIIEAAQE
jgi:inorganic pyrophosphatase